MKTTKSAGCVDFTVPKLAKLLLESSGKEISSQKITEIAALGNLFDEKKRVNLLRYIAFLLSEHTKNGE